ncbi:hypothetical protein E2C01_027991 [Portunus trituberculatus]|uniref:Uncharacterized protein n=1 Tax=Portunus trituberculatus TaxID=210409 RepID=A0A5B7EN14_PORTR|nr:hypothetical protein [Portunus trituberculatus]
MSPQPGIRAWGSRILTPRTPRLLHVLSPSPLPSQMTCACHGVCCDTCCTSRQDRDTPAASRPPNTTLPGRDGFIAQLKDVLRVHRSRSLEPPRMNQRVALVTGQRTNVGSLLVQHHHHYTSRLEPSTTSTALPQPYPPSRHDLAATATLAPRKLLGNQA